MTRTVRRAEARRLALAIGGIDRELADNKCHLADLVTHLAPQLLAKRGVGPVSAAQEIVSWSHPGRCRNEPVPILRGLAEHHPACFLTDESVKKEGGSRVGE